MDHEPDVDTVEPRRLTIEEWAALDEDEEGELVDGVLVEEEMPSFIHEMIVTFLTSLFRGWIVNEGGIVAGSEAKFKVAALRGRKPDLSVYFPERRPDVRASVTDVPPAIMVEILTATPRDVKRDRIHKMDEYARFGVAWYWIVDPELRSLEIFELQAGGRYVRALAADAGKIESVPGCAGLVVDLDALWAEIDRNLTTAQ